MYIQLIGRMDAEPKGADDTIAPSRHAHTLREKYGDRITTVMVCNAGHAAVEEQPHEIASVIVRYIKTKL